MLLSLIFAALAGILMAVQGSMNGALSKLVGAWEGNLLVHAIGLAVLLALVFVFGAGEGGFLRLKTVPWYLYLGGLINVAILYGVMSAVAKIGVAKATTAIIVGQLAMALIVESIGVFGLQKSPLTWGKGLGVLLMGIAAKLML